MICHYTPLLSEPDTSLSHGDLIKLDLGAHIDGFIAVVAHSWVLGATAEAPVTGRKADVMMAAHLASEAARLATFQDWPPGLRQKKEEMAAAGLFYIGLSDQVKCFYCDGGLKEWQAEDDPWVEHAGWFHECEFIKLVKGEEFIERCREIVHTNLVSPTNFRAQSTHRQIEDPSSTPSPSTSPSPPTSPVRGTAEDECATKDEMQIQNARMKRQMRCKVCLNADVGVVFLPCGHLVVCKNCAPNLRNCPVCRSRINETIKVFMS